jgi:hypothetical protein
MPYRVTLTGKKHIWCNLEEYDNDQNGTEAGLLLLATTEEEDDESGILLDEDDMLLFL